jgi:hypothetical protein
VRSSRRRCDVAVATLQSVLLAQLRLELEHGEARGIDIDGDSIANH